VAAVGPRTTIRAATEADLNALVRLLGLLFSLEADFRPDPPRQRRGLLLMLEEPERRVVLVAERAGAVIGMVTLQLVVSTAEGAPSAWIEDMVVEERERGGGVGRALLEAAGRWAHGRGATRLQLLADRANRPALRFYRRLGWCETQLVCLRRGGKPGRAAPSR
jgi:GNAT superfamily N-acetyltransferase